MSKVLSSLRYSAEHEWIDDSSPAKVGITQVAADALGDVVYVDLPEVGDSVTAGETCGEVESTKSVSDIYAPVAGEITAVNDGLDATPELLNSDSYGEGWMYEVRVEDTSVLDDLLDASGYQAQLD